MRSKALTLGILLWLCFFGARKELVAQVDAFGPIQKVLNHPVPKRDPYGSLLPSSVATYQIQSYLIDRVAPLPHPKSAADWTREEGRLRQQILNDVAYHGWPRAWIHMDPHFQQVGVIKTNDGYEIEKFRYQIVPGMVSTALLYLPNKITGRAPAILNLLGHDPIGIAATYEQVRCINFAKRGILALQIEWMGYGDLALPGNQHIFGSALDLVGANDLGLFYLNMERGVDYLISLPDVDASRIGVTGISGGGWQTVIVGALDPRVKVMVEVAGVGTPESNLTHPSDTDEIEEDPPDLMWGRSYPALIAMRAPKPTMSIHNAVDSCCFRAPLVKPGLHTAIKPFFELYQKPQNLGWHEGFHPGTHNYLINNRQQAYRFFTEHFGMPVTPKEIFSSNKLRTAQELKVGVPADDLTILGLAKQFAAQTHRAAIPPAGPQHDRWAASERKELASVIRYAPVSMKRALRVNNDVRFNFQSLSYRFDFSNGLSASGVWFRRDSTPLNQPVTIVLNDKGYRAAATDVFMRYVQGEQVLAFDPIFVGNGAPEPNADWIMLLEAMGGRALGIEAEQLVATAKWVQSSDSPRHTGQRKIRLVTDGIRSQVIALTAADMDPGLFSDIVSGHAMSSFQYLLDKPVSYYAAPDLFCLDLYKDFDIDSLESLASQVKVTETSSAIPEASLSKL